MRVTKVSSIFSSDLFKYTIYVAGLFILLFLVLECFFRWIVPAPEFPERALDTTYDVYKFEPNQEGLYTRGRLIEAKAEWIINNEGWNSEKEYVKGAHIIPIIGDSYVQTLFFNPENHLYNLFQEADPVHDYYAFGIQGASLSQYLNILKYTVTQFDVDSAIIVIDEKDIIESITNLSSMPRNMQLKIKGDEIQEVPPTYFEHPLRQFIKNFATFRYFYMNFEFQLDVGNAKVHKSKKVIKKADGKKQQAVNYIIDEMLKIKPDLVLCFILDADRKAIYKGEEKENSDYYPYFKNYHDNERVVLLDLQDTLQNHYQKYQQKFELSESDHHWNLPTYKLIVNKTIADFVEK
ncbi:hypothetical protein JKA74_05735 [Marivirga sp. S37H4]|uniref:AlgX/AlgJ SGNH hydrolase-like domain-containing protein n=1 Tax=Marivirga aurantiaca TaxID=2802615 RepID=A0A934WX55_9BACT|nr:hypothetical protein [Marivirga aurantiaca]MBK6264532.1 hypothetical protein [Marivirga aurantiaca]